VKQMSGISAIALLFGIAGANAEAPSGTNIVPAAQSDPPYFRSEFARNGDAGGSSLNGSELPTAPGCASLAVSWYELRIIPSEAMDTGSFFVGTGTEAMVSGADHDLRNFEVVLAFIAALYIFPASSATPLNNGEFGCAQGLDNVYEFELVMGRLRVNNFMLSEEKPWFSPNAKVIKLSASASNRSEKPARLTVEVVGFNSQNAIAFAVTAQPLLGLVNPGQAVTIEGNIYSLRHELKDATKFCVRVAGEF
jgi:hypothetical protein